MIEQADIELLLKDAHWLAHRYDAANDCFQMRHICREDHDASTFLTDEYLPEPTRTFSVDRQLAMSKIPKDRELHFIFHSAFCGSTLLARCFNLPDTSMGLKEPMLLNDIVGFRRRGAKPAAVAERLDHSLHMLARPFDHDQAVIVKPSNVFNGLASLAMTMRQSAKAVLIYAPLPVFLASVARKGLWCRLWCRQLLEGLLQDGLVDLGYEPRDYFLQTDLQVAAIGWLAQQKLFQSLAEQFGSRIVTLDSEVLTAAPATMLLAVARHFELEIGTAVADRHPAFTTHSKSGLRFSGDDRRLDQALSVDAHRDEIEKVTTWAAKVAEDRGIMLNLPANSQSRCLSGASRWSRAVTSMQHDMKKVETLIP